MMFESTLAGLVERRLRSIDAPLEVTLWNGRRIAMHPRPLVALRLRSPAAALRLLWPDLGRLAQAFASGDLEIEGSLFDAMAAGERLCASHRSLATRVRRRRPPRRRRHTRVSDLLAVRHHYDVSNDFYRLWLDEELVYSCAYFQTGTESLEDAQLAKLDHICQKLMLRPGERLLDVGCGWGSLVLFAAAHHGAHATGITLSRRQYHLARQRVAERGLQSRCKILMLDYRDLPTEPAFDKAASVGMMEHVGLRNLDGYFSAVGRCLRPGGLFLNHAIASSSPTHQAETYGAGAFLEREIFPSTDLPNLGLAVTGLLGAGFEPVDVEELRPHYARTLRLWLARLEAAEEDAVRLVGPRLYRAWRIYLAGCAYSFDRGWTCVFQTLTGRPDDRGRLPTTWTREHLYASARKGHRSAPAATLRLPSTATSASARGVGWSQGPGDLTRVADEVTVPRRPRTLRLVDVDTTLDGQTG